MRNEARMYWLISRCARNLGAHAAPIDEARDEFSALADNSDWSRLRDRCADNLSTVASVVSAEAVA